MVANWSYEDIGSKVWKIKSLTDFWGIGFRTEKRLKKLGIDSVRALANSNPDHLKNEFGVIGLQLWFHANGVDESQVHEPYHPKSTSLGNSQILPKDYYLKRDIQIVLVEMGEYLAKRLRRQKQKASVFGLSLRFSKKKKTFINQMPAKDRPY